MKKGKIIETPLPEAMIQHIQSFMSGKEAARTTLLSKSWYNAWLTRSTLDLDDRDFGRSTYKFREFGQKTMQRYEELSLKIDSFRLRVEKGIYHTCVDKLIVKALKIGATYLQLDSLPQEVLASQTLLKLSLTDCKIDGNYVVISCWRLKSLTLKNVKFTSGGVDVLKDILRCCCNSLEECELSGDQLPCSSSSLSLLQEVLGCQNLVRLSLSRYTIDGKYVISCSNLKSLTLQSVTLTNVDHVFKDIMMCCISMEELSLSGPAYGLSDAMSGANIYELRKLRRLFLSKVFLDSIMFFTDFASRFPCLEDLSILGCGGCKKIQIASTSLQRISFKPVSGLWRAEFDVPNLRKFTYSDSCLPSHKLSIKAAASREWEFDISISSNKFYERSGFLKLKRYLTKYSQSRISLSINLYARSDESEHEVDAFFVEPKHLVLENLMIDAPPSYCCALLVRLFGICRPKFITHDWSRKNVSLDNLCKRLIIPDKRMFGQFNLKKVNVEVYEMFDTKWRPLLLEEPLDATKTPLNKRKVQFEFIWD